MRMSTAKRVLMMTGAASAVLMIAAPALAQTAPAKSDPALVDEVIVTASKRPQQIRDVPGSVTAVTGKQLEALGAASFADYIQRTPGANFNEYQPGVSHVVLRGIATSAGNEQGQGTVGYYINDVPLTEPGFTIVVPDIDAFDVNRVEILRGPQGTLFGSASLGGVVNYIANEADASGMDAAVEGTVNKTRNADAGYAVKGMFNLPIVEDKLAVRAVYSQRLDQGYLDNIGTGVDGSNDVLVKGGRVSIVWTPVEGTKLSWLSLFQKTEADDAGYRQPALGDLTRNTSVPETVNTEVQVHSLKLEQDVGFANLTAIAAYSKKSEAWIIDYTPIRGAYNGDLQLNLTNPLYISSGGESEGKSLEFRLASKGETQFQWLVGATYFKTDKPLYETIASEGAAAQFNASPLFGPGSGAIIAPDGKTFNAFYSDIEGEETALFGEASYAFTPQWKLTLGGRLFRTEISTRTTQVGFSTYPGAPIISSQSTKDDGFSPKVALEFRPAQDLMIYGLVSKGFRFGQPNNIPALAGFDTPAGSKSDSLINYELGLRSRPIQNLTLDVTAFYVDWSDIQVRLQRPDFYNYATNGSSAVSRGVELSANWRPLDRLQLQSNVTFMEAKLTEPLVVPFYGTAQKGSQLPGSSKWSISNMAVYSFGGEFNPTVTLSHRYLSGGVSDLSSVAAGAPNRQGDYNLFDARLRMVFGPTSVTLFGNNLSDERGVTRTVNEAVGLGQGIVRPRTFGVTFAWQM